MAAGRPSCGSASPRSQASYTSLQNEEPVVNVATLFEKALLDFGHLRRHSSFTSPHGQGSCEMNQ